MQRAHADEAKAGQGRRESPRCSRSRRQADQERDASCWSRSWACRGSAGRARASPRRSSTRARAGSRQGDDDLRRHDRDPEQHHRQAHAWPARTISKGDECDMAVLTEEQQMLRDRRQGSSSTENAPVGALRKLRDSEERHSASIRRAWQEHRRAWAGPASLVPESYGGSDFGCRRASVSCSRSSAALSSPPRCIGSAVGAASALTLGGSEAQKQGMAAEDRQRRGYRGLGHRRGNALSARTIALAATKKGSGYTLKGIKTFVHEGMAADCFRRGGAQQQAARATRDGVTLFLIPADRQGLDARTPPARWTRAAMRRSPSTMWRSAPRRLSAKWTAAADCSTRSSIAPAPALAAEMLGVAAQAFETTRRLHEDARAVRPE